MSRQKETDVELEPIGDDDLLEQLFGAGVSEEEPARPPEPPAQAPKQERWKTDVFSECVYWEDYALSHCTVSKRWVPPRPYQPDEPCQRFDSRELEHYLLLEHPSFVARFTEARALARFCLERGIALERAFAANLADAVKVFRRGFAIPGLLITPASLAEEYVLDRGFSVSELYPSLEGQRATARWAVIPSQTNQEGSLLVDVYTLSLPHLELSCSRETLSRR
jgi:hypothetical protein